MRGVSSLFIDTNILIYATNAASPWHTAATTALQDAYTNGVALVISSQVVREYLAAATRVSAAGAGPSVATLISNAQAFRHQFQVLADNPQVLDNLLTLMQQISIGGKQVHDANIVATMQAYKVQSLLTHNVADFTRFSHLIRIVPLV
jgi:predicted nucleic acid-binding protein